MWQHIQLMQTRLYLPKPQTTFADLLAKVAYLPAKHRAAPLFLIVLLLATGLVSGHGTYLDFSRSPGTLATSPLLQPVEAQPDANVFTASGSNYFDIPDNAALRLSTFSLGTWFKTGSDYSNARGIIANKGGFGTNSILGEIKGYNLNYGIWIEQDASKGKDHTNEIGAGFETQFGNDVIVYSKDTYNDNKWHYAVLTFNGDVLTLYVDGASAASKDTSNVPDTSGSFPLRLAADSQYNGGLLSSPLFFRGSIDDVRLWNRAISASEIAAGYNSGNYDPRGLVVYMNGVSANYVPVARAGPDKEVNDGTAGVTLDGTSSSDLDGSITSFQWKQVSGQPTVSLTGANTAKASFNAPILTSNAVLSFRLTVTDDKGASSYDEVNVTILHTNTPPVGDAGPDKSVNEGTATTLDGSKSSDPDSGPQSLTFHWDQIAGPVVTLSSSGVPKPTFTAPQVSANTPIEFRLTVSDGAALDVDYVIVTVLDSIPSPSQYDYEPYYSFSGSDYKEVPDSNALHLTQFSIAAWFQTSKDYSSATVKSLIANKGGFGSDAPGKNMNYGIWFENGDTLGNKIGAGFEGSSGVDYFLVSPNKYNDGNWHYAVVTFDGSILRLYLDGSEVNSKSVSELPDNAGNSPFRAGANANDNSRYYTGNLDEIRVWDRAVSAQEVTDQFSGIVLTEGQLIYMDGTYIEYPNANTILMTRGVAPSGEPNFRDDLAYAISNAVNYVHLSTFYVETYSTNNVVNSLQAAVQRGVEVRVMVAHQSVDQYPDMEAELQARGISYKLVDNHAKIAVIDDRIAYLGSANLNKNGLEGNWEMTVRTTKPSTIAEAKDYLKNLWEIAQKAPVLNLYTDERFVSGSEYLDLLIQGLKSASSVKLFMFETTYNFGDPNAPESRVLTEVKNANQRGADLQLLFDDPRYCVRFGGERFLTQNNIPHKLDDDNTGSHERLHAKAVLIDNEVLFIGSQNWNDDSIASILDAGVMTTDPDLVSDFETTFASKYELGLLRSEYDPCVNDFSISANPTSISVVAGESAASTITITSINGFNSGVALTTSPAISGVTVSFTPNPVTPPVGGTASSTLTINTSSTTPKGAYTLTVTGATSSTPQHKTTITITIT